MSQPPPILAPPIPFFFIPSPPQFPSKAVQSRREMIIGYERVRRRLAVVVHRRREQPHCDKKPRLIFLYPLLALLPPASSPSVGPEIRLGPITAILMRMGEEVFFSWGSGPIIRGWLEGGWVDGGGNIRLITVKTPKGGLILNQLRRRLLPIRLTLLKKRRKFYQDSLQVSLPPLI